MNFKEILEEERPYLVQHLDFLPVADFLISKHILSEEEFNFCDSEKTSSGKVRALLSCLTRKDPSHLETFIDSLKDIRGQEHVYSRLMSHIKGHIITISNVMKPWSYYLERKGMQEEIREAFKQSSRETVCLTGMAGSGKTQLSWWYAAHFIENHDRGYIVWNVNGSSEENIKSDLQNIAVELGGAEKLRICPRANDIESKDVPSFEQFLTNLQSATCEIPALLIVDNLITDNANTLQTIENTLSSWQILVNTCRKNNYTKRQIAVDGFTKDEAVNFTETILQDTFKEFKIEELIGLFQKLGFSPLGITSVLFYMNTMKIDVATYESILSKQFEEVKDIQKKMVRENTGYEETQNSIRLVLSAIQKQYSQEFKVFKYMSLCAMDHMLPIKIFTPLIQEQDEEIRIVKMGELLKALDDVHFLTETKGLSLNRTVAFHKSVQENLEHMVRKEKPRLISEFMLHILSHFPKEAVIKEWYKGNRLLKPHVLSLLNHAEDITRSPKDELARIKLYDIIGYIESKTGLRDEAREHLTLAKDAFYKVIGLQETNLPLYQEIARGSVVDFESDIIKQQILEEAHGLLTSIKDKLSGVLSLDDILKIRRAHIHHAYHKAKEFDNEKPDETVNVNTMYNKLVQKSRFFKEDLLVEIYPVESFAVVLYSTVYYKPRNPEEKMHQQHDLHLCKTLCQLIREKHNLSDNQAILHEMLSERDGLLEMEITQNSQESLQRAKKAYIALLENGKEYFYLGLSFLFSMRSSGQRSDLYYRSVCLKQILKCTQALYELTNDDQVKNEIIQEVDGIVTNNQEIIDDLQKHEELKYALSELQIAFGNIYKRFGRTEKAVEFYEKVYDNSKHDERDCQGICAVVWLFKHYENNGDEGATEANTERAQKITKYRKYVQNICAKKPWYKVEVEETPRILSQNP